MATTTQPPRDSTVKRPPRHGSFVRQPTTILAAIVLVGSAVAAIVIQGRGSDAGGVAARVGTVAISDATVEREVAAISSQPTYAAALGHTSTIALAAPVDPKAVARANGDPDDLRITFAPAGGSVLRPYTTADLKAAVLTRLLYVTALGDVLARKHAAPTATELADGHQEAELNAGINALGRSLLSELPAWYQRQLAERGADIEALVRVLFGTAAITANDIQIAYNRRVAADFTTVCLRSVVVPTGQEAAGRKALAAGDGTRDDGCAPVSSWAPDVAVAVSSADPSTPGPSVTRRGMVALLEVTHRTVAPLPTVAVDVRAELLSRYTDLVNTMVEDELALLHVTVAPRYGTYESFGAVHDVLPPDALTPPPAAGSQQPTPPTTSGPRGQMDPFE